MLEWYAPKGACAVLRGGGKKNLTSLPDYRKAMLLRGEPEAGTGAGG